MATLLKWRDGFHSPAITAEDAGAEMERIRMSTGDLTAESIIEAAEPEGSVLHAAFTWDDEAAAIAWRKREARALRGALIEYEVADEAATPSAEHQRYSYVTVADDEGATRRKFAPTTVLLAEEESRLELLERARRYLEEGRRRFSTLRELSGIFRAVDDTFKDAAE